MERIQRIGQTESPAALPEKPLQTAPAPESEAERLLRAAKPSSHGTARKRSTLTTVLAVLFLVGVAYGAILVGYLDQETVAAGSGRGWLFEHLPAFHGLRDAAGRGDFPLRIQRGRAAVLPIFPAFPGHWAGDLHGILLQPDGRKGDPAGNGYAAAQWGAVWICATAGVPGVSEAFRAVFPIHDCRGGHECTDLPGIWNQVFDIGGDAAGCGSA